jgi:tRNA-splicing ligase RtcB
MYVVGDKFPVKAWVKGIQVENKAWEQLLKLARLPFIHQHIAVMPDVHWGLGATVGSVVPTKGAVIPAAVGVDIGCGMLACKTSLVASDLPDDLSPLLGLLGAAVPHGRTDNGGPEDAGAWRDPPERIRAAAAAYRSLLAGVLEKYPLLARAVPRIERHLGTLGTGNHFLEVCLDESQSVWVMLHSGSRGIGNAIGQMFIELAKKDMERWFIHLPDADLAYIPHGSALFRDYLAAVEWAQMYAQDNRNWILKAALEAMRLFFGDKKTFTVDEMAINCHHNYVAWEHHFGQNVLVTRKGAINAGAGVLGVIPGSMGAKSFIVRGKGNRDSFNSCSHGAGRLMSRGEATKKFTVQDHIEATRGVTCRKDPGVLDETPAAYKPIDDVMRAQSDLVEVVHTLKQVVCLKG